MDHSPSAPEGYRSLSRGLEILSLVQEVGRLRAVDISRRLDLPLSTAYRYIAALRNSGFVVDIDGALVPSSKLAETGEDSEHLVRYAAPVLKRMRDESNMSASVVVRVHTAAVCLDAAFAHPKHKISFRRGQVRALYAGGSALPLLAFAPPSIVRDVLEGTFRHYTAATPNRTEVEAELDRIRKDGYAVSYGQILPGMVAVGVPVMIDGQCLCSLSLIGEARALTSIDNAVNILRAGARELLGRMSPIAASEAWSIQSNELDDADLADREPIGQDGDRGRGSFASLNDLRKHERDA